MPSLSEQSRLVHYGAIFLLAVLALLPGNETFPLIDRDEPRFTQAAREMVQRDNWVVPYFNDEYRFDKPPLTYWLMRGSFALFGQNEFSARLHSALAALLVAFLLYEAGRWWFSRNAGLWSAFGWLTCLQVLLHGRLAVADMPMVFAVTLSHVAMAALLFHIKNSRQRWIWFGVLYLSLAAGFLAKGPIAWLSPLLTLILYRGIFWRKPVRWKRLHFFLGIPLVLALIAMWGIPALTQTDGAFWNVGMNEHVVQRGVKAFNSRAFLPFLYYPLTSVLSLFPWIAFAGVVWTSLRQNWNAKNAFLVSWFAAPYLIFSFYATQLPHYVLPGFPAFFLLLGLGLDARGVQRRWHAAVFGFVGLVGLLVAGALAGVASVEHFSRQTQSIQDALFCLSGVLLSLVLMVMLARRRHRGALFIPVTMLALCWSALAIQVREAAPAVRLKPVLEQVVKSRRPFWYRGFEEPSLVFYTNHPWRVWDGTMASLREEEPAVVVVLNKETRLEDYLQSRFKREPLQPRTSNRPTWVEEFYAQNYRPFTTYGLNLARLSWVQIRAWIQVRPSPRCQPPVSILPLLQPNKPLP